MAPKYRGSRGFHRRVILAAFVALISFAGCDADEEVIRLRNDIAALDKQLSMLAALSRQKSEELKEALQKLAEECRQNEQLLQITAKLVAGRDSGNRNDRAIVAAEMSKLTSSAEFVFASISALSAEIQGITEPSLRPKAFAHPPPESPSPAAGSGPEDQYRQAFASFIRAEFEAAIQAFNRFLDEFPNDENAEEAQIRLGEAYAYSGNWTQAVASCSRFLAKYPSSTKAASVYLQRAKGELALLQKGEAVADLRTIIRAFPHTAEATRARIELEKLGIRP
jgi:TolA-binding protein